MIERTYFTGRVLFVSFVHQPNIRLATLGRGGLPPLCGVTHTAAEQFRQQP